VKVVKSCEAIKGVERRLARIGWEVLRRGGSALEAVEAAVSALEDDDAFDAGRKWS
jgi:beta-aspartyl-peptidase (threonine type)